MDFHENFVTNRLEFVMGLLPKLGGWFGEGDKMAKIKKRKISWEAPASSDVVGYKLYWAVGEKVTYDSNCVNVGMNKEVVLPDAIPSFPITQKEIEIAITAVNEIGNESDLARLCAPFQFSVPETPTNLAIEATHDFYVCY